MSLYRWRSGFSPGISAEAAALELERLREVSGVLRPADVVEAARSPGSPLHKAFTWEDTEAAEQWRQHEARRLLSGIRILQKPAGQKPVLSVAYVSVKDADRGRGYQPLGDVMEDEDNRLRVLQEALQQLEGFQRRYAHLEELSEVFEAFRQVASPSTP